MATNRKTVPIETKEPRSSNVWKRMAEIGMLLWMLSITFLWWLLYGPGMTFITQKMGFLAVLGAWRASLLQYFTFISWGIQ